MSDSAISVLHLSERDEETLLKTHKQIASELESGRDVVLVLEEPVSRRAERMTLASLSFKKCSGRFAVVTGDTRPFSQLPQSVAERLHVFTTAEAAVEWLQPSGFDFKDTMLYLSLN